MKKNLGIVSLLAALTACGDEYNTYNMAGTSDGYSNSCGNSPLYGLHLFEIWQCKVGFTMKEDCSVDKVNNPHNLQISYSGLNITFDGLGTWAFDPAFRFALGPECSGQEQTDNSCNSQKIECLNKKLDKYGGYVLIWGTDDGCRKNSPDDCAFVPVPSPFSGRYECMDSEYYAGGVTGGPEAQCNF